MAERITTAIVLVADTWTESMKVTRPAMTLIHLLFCFSTTRMLTINNVWSSHDK